jgi:single-strand DNA-binding protein
MNKVFMIGNLSKDVDLRTTQSGKAVATLTIAVNRTFSRSSRGTSSVKCAESISPRGRKSP